MTARSTSMGEEQGRGGQGERRRGRGERREEKGRRERKEDTTKLQNLVNSFVYWGYLKK